MKEFGLTEWSSVAEILGTVAVVVSLLIVAYSIDRNTTALSGQIINEMYDANREISQMLLANPELESTINRGRTNYSSLSDLEELQYLRYVGLTLDIWEKSITRENEGLVVEDSIDGWHQYHEDFVAMHLTKELWDEIKWQWKEPELHRRVDEALSSD